MYACQKERCKEENPTLSFSDYTYIPKVEGSGNATDSLIIKYAFEDCQGDVGLTEGDERYNLRTYLYELIHGEWQRFYPENLADTVAFFARVPTSSKVREGTKAEGFIEQRFGSIRQNSDTIRFETRLFDRAGNRSEQVTTPTFVIPR